MLAHFAFVHNASARADLSAGRISPEGSKKEEGCADNSYWYSSGKSSVTFLEAVSNRWNSSWGSTDIDSLPTLIEFFTSIKTSWSFRLKVCPDTHFPCIESRIPLPTSFALSALTFVPAVTPFDMLWSEQLELNGFLLMRYWRTASVSLLSLSMRVSVISLCFSLEQ